MAVLCKNFNLLYICIPKTGSTSVSNFLINKLDGEWIPKNHILDKQGNIKVDKKHSKIRDLLEYDVLKKTEIDTLNIFTTVRNPFDMVLSNYFFEMQIFEEFRSGILLRTALGTHVYFFLKKLFKFDKFNEFSWIIPQYKRYLFTKRHTFEEYVEKFYSTKSANLYLDYVEDCNTTFLKLENIDQELKNFLANVGFYKRSQLSHLSKSKKKTGNYRDFYTKKSRMIIERTFKKELEYFEYQF